MNGCMEGGINVKRIITDEHAILEDFSSNVEIYINGQKVSKSVEQRRPHGTREIPENIIIEPGQVDPATFFGSSLQGLI